MSDLIERLREKAEAIPAEERDWYTLDQPWLGRDMETMILSGNPDPHVGVMVCDFQDAGLAGVEDRYEDEDWTARNWAMAEYIAAADPNTVLALIKEISELREALKPFATAMGWFERRMGDEMQFLEEDSHMIGCEITVAHLRRARAKLEGSGA